MTLEIPTLTDSKHYLFPGQSVKISYDKSFQDEYPFTFARFNGNTGTVAWTKDSIIGVKLSMSDVVTIVERKYLRGLGMPG